jgi:hypothetical protein
MSVIHTASCAASTYCCGIGISGHKAAGCHRDATPLSSLLAYSQPAPVAGVAATLISDLLWSTRSGIDARGLERHIGLHIVCGEK